MKAVVFAAMLVTSEPVSAQALMQHDMTRPVAPSVGAGASSQAFQAAEDKMMAGMSRPLSGDPDRDFVTGMLPHHQGAVDMAKVELQFGHDPGLRELARNVVDTQEKEIAMMRQWERAHPTK